MTMGKFKVGQKVRLKSHEELRQIGTRLYIKVGTNFKHTSEVLTIGSVNSTTYSINEWKSFSFGDYNFHEDFFQPAYELDDKFKEL